MRRLLTALLLVIALSGSACGSDQSSYSGSSSPSPELATTIIDTGDEVVLVDTEVADSPEERAQGLMHRKSLGEDEGMMFLYFEPQNGWFWMKDTTIPLSIAFFDHQGRIIEMMDMHPCRAEPCKTYSPDEPYWGALEVNQGAFEQWGVEEGDVIHSNQ